METKGVGEEGVSLHLFDDPATRLGLELGMPITTCGGGCVGVDGGRVAPLSGPPISVAHGTLLVLHAFSWI
jgi:hypothetical protein